MCYKTRKLVFVEVNSKMTQEEKGYAKKIKELKLEFVADLTVLKEDVKERLILNPNLRTSIREEAILHLLNRDAYYENIVSELKKYYGISTEDQSEEVDIRNITNVVNDLCAMNLN